MDNYLLSVFVFILACLVLYGSTGGTSSNDEAQPHDEPAEPTPELDPEIYAHALASLLIEAELAGMEQVIRNQVQRRGDDEAGKGAKV